MIAEEKEKSQWRLELKEREGLCVSECTACCSREGKTEKMRVLESEKNGKKRAKYGINSIIIVGNC